MKRTKIYFLSDIHLGASYISDSRSHEKKVVDWLQSIEPECKELYLVGDILDYWYEYRHVVPRGYVRFFGQLARMSDSGIKITWFIGNHDIWIFDYLPNELGLRVVDGSLTEMIGGKKFYIAHGDAAGTMSRGFRFLRKVFRNKICQRVYSAIHPGLTIPFAHRWSASSREGGGCASVSDKKEWLEGLTLWARQLQESDNELNYIIVGHYHELLDQALSDDCRLIVLGDWIDKFSYAVFDGGELKIGNIV